jgi:hypothetical protein
VSKKEESKNEGSIKSTVYRNKNGFLIYGKDPQKRKIQIFTNSKNSAEAIRNFINNRQSDSMIPIELFAL